MGWPRVLLRAAGGVLVGTFAGGYAFQSYMSGRFGADALPRMVEAYSTSVPAFAQYKFTELTLDKLPRAVGRPVDEAALGAEYARLHARWAQPMLRTFLALRGFYIKTGQMIASNFGDAAPEHWQKTFEPLLEHVPPKPFEVVRRTVEGEFGGRPLESIFSSFDPEPIASASIGQVHRAVLAGGGGERVVVKVMYNEVEGQFRGDVATARFFMEVAMPEHVPALAEIEKQFASEFDYRAEAAQLAAVRRNLAAAGAFGDVLVPAPLPALCTKRVLTMTEVPACETLARALERDMTAYAASRGLSMEALRAEERAANEAALARGELRAGVDAPTMDAYVSAIRWRNWLGGFLGRAPDHVPLNHARLVDTIFAIHGHEVLVDGFFNGDPHPGNILLSYGSSGRVGVGRADLALVDYGQVKRLGREQRLAFARLIRALATCDEAVPAHRAAVADAFRALGNETQRNDPEVLFKLARIYFDRDDRLVTEGKFVQAYIEELAALDPVKKVADDFVLAGRCSLMLRGLGHQLNQHRSCARAWLPFANKVLREAGEIE